MYSLWSEIPIMIATTSTQKIKQPAQINTTNIKHKLKQSKNHCLLHTNQIINIITLRACISDLLQRKTIQRYEGSFTWLHLRLHLKKQLLTMRCSPRIFFKCIHKYFILSMLSLIYLHSYLNSELDLYFRDLPSFGDETILRG